mgnify:CR=1 FL=1
MRIVEVSTNHLNDLIRLNQKVNIVLMLREIKDEHLLKELEEKKENEAPVVKQHRIPD